MCGISGLYQLSHEKYNYITNHIEIMNKLQEHRGPDGEGVWIHTDGFVGFGHRRLSIIDLKTGDQPMNDGSGNWITYNGEIYNFKEIREEIGIEIFTTASDTEVILRAYRKWGISCVQHLKGMFAFAIWDDKEGSLFCARDRFGIKPFYYAVDNNNLYFASEIKALLPFIKKVDIDLEGLKDYLTFQFCLKEKTLFKGVKELLPGHTMIIKNGSININKYWEVYYTFDFNHTEKYFEEKIYSLLEESIKLHLRSDVPLGAYISGGLDSSIVASLGSGIVDTEFVGFTGKFTYSPEYDESIYAKELAKYCGFELYEIDINVEDFLSNIGKVIYHLDYPVAGPGSFPQFIVSGLASRYRKVVLGGTGGDEIFGGYVRYLLAYFEQCIKGAIDGTMHSGNFIVTYESIIPNLVALRNYKPLIKKFWQEGLFEELDKRYFRLVNRAPDLKEEIEWKYLDGYSSFDDFRSIFNGDNVGKQSYFDLMTHFDFKTLLPALLQVEDRVSMAHGLESRVPLLDHPLVELAATIPSNIKFESGQMKQVFKNAVKKYLPDIIINRKDKMGFPVPLSEWMKEEAREFIFDVFSSQKALRRDLINNKVVLKKLDKESKFGRNIWGLLCLELWQTEFIDKSNEFKKLLNT